jgi:hypothetical protein
MSNKQLRIVSRLIHLVGSGFIGTYVYSSALSSDPTFAFIVQFVVFPSLAITGLVMWQQPRISKLLRRSVAS